MKKGERERYGPRINHGHSRPFRGAWRIGQGQHGGLIDGIGAESDDEVRIFNFPHGNGQPLIQPPHHGPDLPQGGGLHEEVGILQAREPAKPLERRLGFQAAPSGAHAQHGPAPSLLRIRFSQSAAARIPSSQGTS